MKKQVPYVSQWADPAFNERIAAGTDPCEDPSWRSTGFTDPDDYRFWARRICGLACFQAILAYYDIPALSNKALLARALEEDAYRLREDGGVEGLIYDPFLAFATRDFPLKGQVLRHCDVQQIESVLPEDGFLIWSVSTEIRRPAKKNIRDAGHLILIHSADRNGCRFHNPSGVAPEQADVAMSYDVLERFSSKRGMVIERR